jgi:hypothetical protein
MFIAWCEIVFSFGHVGGLLLLAGPTYQCACNSQRIQKRTHNLRNYRSRNDFVSTALGMGRLWSQMIRMLEGNSRDFSSIWGRAGGPPLVLKMPFLDISVSNFNLVEILFKELLRIFELSVVGIHSDRIWVCSLKSKIYPQLHSCLNFFLLRRIINPLSRICLQEANRKHWCLSREITA